jgi:hypothetical protein
MIWLEKAIKTCSAYEKKKSIRFEKTLTEIP